MERTSRGAGIRPNRQMRRAALQTRVKGETRKGRTVYQHGGFRDRDDSAVFIPRRTSFKGYMRQKSTFNKRKRAA